MFQSAAFGVVENANVAEILREAGPQASGYRHIVDATHLLRI